MKIINRSKNTILAQEAVIADTLLKRITGLLGKKEFRKAEALILKPCNSIHTFFMRFAIDVLFVDNNNKVVKAISGLQPFCLTAIYFKSALAIELPANTIEATLTRPGDLILIN